MCACVCIGAFNLTDGKIRDALLHKNGKQMNRESKKVRKNGFEKSI